MGSTKCDKSVGSGGVIMAFLGNTPHLETASPFQTPPTVIQTSVSKINEALLTGIGVAIGTSIGAYFLLHIFGKRS